MSKPTLVITYRDDDVSFKLVVGLAHDELGATQVIDNHIKLINTDNASNNTKPLARTTKQVGWGHNTNNKSITYVIDEHLIHTTIPN